MPSSTGTNNSLAWKTASSALSLRQTQDRPALRPPPGHLRRPGQGLHFQALRYHLCYPRHPAHPGHALLPRRPGQDRALLPVRSVRLTARTAPLLRHHPPSAQRVSSGLDRGRLSPQASFRNRPITPRTLSPRPCPCHPSRRRRGTPRRLPPPQPAQVHKSATFSFQHDCYRVPAYLRGQTVELCYDPFDLTRIEVWFQNTFLQVAEPGRIVTTTHPDVEPDPAPPPSSSTGLDYLALLRTERERLIQQQLDDIHFTQLAPPPINSDKEKEENDERTQ